MRLQATELASYGDRFVARVIDYVPILAGSVLLWRSLPEPAGLLTFMFVGFGISFLNDGVLTGLKGGTIGKLVVGTRVVRYEDWQPIGFARAVNRWAAITVAGFLPIIGLLDPLWIFSGELRQTIHDKMAQTLVISVRSR